MSETIKKALEGLGFTVMKYEDCSQKTMKRAMDKFGRKLKGRDVGLFFYAGHGVQVNGHNYLLPVDAKLDTEHDAEYDCVRADRVLAKMEGAGSKTNIAILDACRDNPFERSWRRGTEGTGLAFMNAPSGSLIAYSTAPGKTALDGRGDNSPYTSALLQHIGTPNITVLEMFQGVRSTVMEKSGYKQTPWESTSLRGNFYFTKLSHAAPVQSDGIKDYGKIIEERNANRKKWNLWQKGMEAALAKVERYDKSNALNPEEKAEAWKGMLASYGADNPYTAKDDEFRKKAGERNLYWKGYKKSGKLFVDTAPTGAKIRILNIGPKFYQGMELKPGRYQVEASKRGFQTKKMWVRLEPGEDKRVDIGLEQFLTSLGERSAYSPSLSISYYLIEVKNRIKSNWQYPVALISPSKQKDLVSTVVITVRQDGTILKSWISDRSGNAIFDASVIKAVERSNPLPPFPEEFKKRKEEIEIKFDLGDIKGHPTPEVKYPPDQKLYDINMALYRGGKYEEAIVGFKNFIKKYPKSRLADNAAFWIGESYMSLKQYEKAILAFQKVIKKYPRGNKVPTARLKQSQAFYELNDKVSAKLLLRKLIKIYPKSNEAKIARSRLKSMNR